MTEESGTLYLPVECDPEHDPFQIVQITGYNNARDVCMARQSQTDKQGRHAATCGYRPDLT
ncbi:hypothetical protein KDI_24940 [Dictyobacter arantiisoli]|uniref:Uncharacterized protein n=1 Tax=Dictyobacter arantiisoli TaxID=2014874 RepID=A0A5A5TBR1_9CHLR|nr:hypothetical protein KDI_24940 [Dictyobacter arantiisoli]